LENLDLRVCSAQRKEGLGETLSHHVPVFKGWLQRRWRLPFYKESRGKDGGIKGRSYFWGDSDWAQEENFSQ